jgi:hypothetical protein
MEVRLSELFNSETFWLTLVNIALGLAVLAYVFISGRAVVQELKNRAERSRRLASKSDSGNFNLASLGITLQDGGEPLNEMKQALRQSNTPDNSPQIVRSGD